MYIAGGAQKVHHKETKAHKNPATAAENEHVHAQSFESFKKDRKKQDDPHALAKERIKKQIESAFHEKRLERLKDLSFLVKRAFDLAVATGEVVIGKDRDELADDGMVGIL
jgi:hypothetical protein